MASMPIQQLQALEGLLKQREAELGIFIREQTARSADAHYADLAGTVSDEGDESVADVLTDIDNATVNRHVAELRDIQAALKRLDEKTYGQCVDCGQDIGFLRLAAYPTAKRCALCQDQHEHTYAEPPHTTL